MPWPRSRTPSPLSFWQCVKTDRVYIVVFPNWKLFHHPFFISIQLKRSGDLFPNSSGFSVSTLLPRTPFYFHWTFMAGKLLHIHQSLYIKRCECFLLLHLFLFTWREMKKKNVGFFILWDEVLLNTHNPTISKQTLKHRIFYIFHVIIFILCRNFTFSFTYPYLFTPSTSTKLF